MRRGDGEWDLEEDGYGGTESLHEASDLGLRRKATGAHDRKM